MNKFRMGINDFINACWDLDDEGWSFNLVCDQWWGIYVDSERYGKFSRYSVRYNDVEETLFDLFQDIKHRISLQNSTSNV